MNDRKLVISVAGATVCIVLLLTCALLPSTSNGAVSDEEAILGAVPAGLGVIGFLGWIVAERATATRAWTLPLSLVAAWGVLFGALTAFVNWSGRSHYENSLLSQRETTYRYQNESMQDKGSSTGQSYPAEMVAESREEEAYLEKNLARCNRGLIFGLGYVAIGGGAVFLRRRALHSGVANPNSV